MKVRSKIFITVLAVLVLAMALLPVLFNEETAVLDDAARARAPGSFVRLPAGTVHYELSGPAGAPTVVLVHGFSVPYYVWDPAFQALTREGMRVLRYDLYGRGYSDRPKADYSLDFFVAQLTDLLDALKIDGRVALVGLSMGGPIAAAFADRYPARTRALCLFDPQAVPENIFPLNVPLVGEYIMNACLAPFMLPQSQPHDFFRPERFPDWERRYHEQMRYAGFRRALLSTIRRLAVVDASSIYRSAAARGLPVLLVWGKADTTISAADIAKVREAVPAAVFLPVDEAGHLACYERPEAVNPVLIAFLNKNK